MEVEVEIKTNHAAACQYKTSLIHKPYTTISVYVDNKKVIEKTVPASWEGLEDLQDYLNIMSMYDKQEAEGDEDPTWVKNTRIGDYTIIIRRFILDDSDKDLVDELIKIVEEAPKYHCP